jgi:hypothetical protein
VRTLGRGLRRLLGLLLVLALVVGGLRVFGDAATQRQLDRLEVQMKVGWERLRDQAGLR